MALCQSFREYTALGSVKLLICIDEPFEIEETIIYSCS